MALRQLRIKTLTELQGALIPLVLRGKHVIAHAETGSGKSFGIALAIANRVLRDSVNYRLHTLILVPTEELALQYEKWFIHFGSGTSQVVQVAIDSIPLEQQLAKLHNVAPHILVGTPSRIAAINHLSVSIIGEKLRRKVDCLVLDEADLILQSTNLHGTRCRTGAELVDRLFRTHVDEIPAQMVAISATMDGRTARTLNT
uniref:ATP-dependent RNA helicase DBP8 n=1 Tax=Lygus hesperus TaxID=30085 RepID=A0A0A9YNE7_LYGHE